MRTNHLVLVFSLSVPALLPNAMARQTTPPLQTGYIRLIPDNGTTSPVGVAILRLRSKGTLLTETGVPVTTTILSGRIFAEVGGMVNTGIALANPNDQDVVITYYFTDASGNNFNDGSFTLPAKHQVAQFFTEEPFTLVPSLTGTFTFAASARVAAIGLRSLINERNEQVMTTLPVSALGAGFGGKELLIPRFTNGGSWTTQVVLVNPGDTVLTGLIRFFGKSKNGNMQPVKVIVNGRTSASVWYFVQPRSAFQMVGQPARDGSQISSIQIRPTSTRGAPSGLVLLSCKSGEVTVSSASLPALPPSRAFRMYVESSGDFGRVGSIQTGLSISNPNTATVTVQMSVMNLDGTLSGRSTSVDIAAGGQIAKFAYELFPQLRSAFKGVLTIHAQSPINVTGLRSRHNERNDLLLTATPPYDDASPALAETIFPHFISGAGYSTQLILFSTGSSQTGALLLVSKDGIILPSLAAESIGKRGQ